LNPPTTQCNDDRLRRLLAAAEDSSEYASAARHVESCPACQSRLGALAAEDSQWSEARQWLSTDDQQEAYRREHRSRRNHAGASFVDWNETLARQLLSPPSHPEMLGRLGRYEVERLIGAGGMGVVFKGFDTELNRPVAIKVLAPHLAGSGAARRRFAREARAAAAIVHEHVVAIHDVESDAEPPFLVMQYIAGQSLQARLDRDGPLSLCEVLRIARQTASALAAAHEQGLVHRDIKPANILLEHDVDRTLLTDFGLARASDDASLTRSGHLPGTPHFMSPEQARGEAVDARSDLFSLASVLYAMCAGRPPFRAESSFGVLRRITDSEPRPLREINPEIPDWLCRLIERLHAKQPDDRYQSAAEVAELLSQCLAHVQQPESHPLPPELAGDDGHGRAQWKRRTIATVGAAGVALLALGAAVAFSPGMFSSHDGGASNLHSSRDAGETGAAVNGASPAAESGPRDDDLSTRWDDEIGESLDDLDETIQQLDEDSRQLFFSAPSNPADP
jgi:serine/threonine protein kinase